MSDDEDGGFEGLDDLDSPELTSASEDEDLPTSASSYDGIDGRVGT